MLVKVEIAGSALACHRCRCGGINLLQHASIPDGQVIVLLSLPYACTMRPCGLHYQCNHQRVDHTLSNTHFHARMLLFITRTLNPTTTRHTLRSTGCSLACAPSPTISIRTSTLFCVFPEERGRTSACVQAAEAQAMMDSCREHARRNARN